LVLDESQEQILNQSTELQKELEKLELELKNTSKSLDKMLLQTREEEETFLKKRELVTKGISRPILSTYDRIRKARGGVAIAMLKNGSCSECSSRIPPQRGLEIRMMDRLHFCEVCGRILVWRPEMDGTERA
jgi:predicted  nucleic acid-binding Zn-ribbon protein